MENSYSTDSNGDELSCEAVRAFIAGINTVMVEKVYSGKYGCMCGCKGKYYESNARGMARRIINIFQDYPDAVRVQNGYILYIPEEAGVCRNYVMYLRKTFAI